MKISLPYLKREVETAVTSKGFDIYPGVDDCYRGQNIRNVYVIKYDPIKLVAGEFFEMESIEEYREIIFNIIAGAYANDMEDTVRQFLEELSYKDKVLQYRLSYIYYFDLHMEGDLLKAFITHLAAKLAYYCQIGIQIVPVKKYLFTSQLFIYYSVDKDQDILKYLLEQPTVEVLSC